MPITWTYCKELKQHSGIDGKRYCTGGKLIPTAQTALIYHSTLTQSFPNMQADKHYLVAIGTFL